MHCERCGEAVHDPGPVCFYCGAPVHHGPQAPVASSARFALAEQHPGYAAACAREVELAPGRLGRAIFGLVFAGGIVTIGGLISAQLNDSLLTFGWWAIGLCITSVAAYEVFMAIWLAVAPMRHVLAVVVEEGYKVEFKVKHEGTARAKHETKQHYCVTLQTRDGKRKKWRCSAKFAGKVDVPDIGVAISKGPRLLKFVRLDVPLA